MTIQIGKRYRVFLTNRFQYEGKVLAVTDTLATLWDQKANTEITLVLDNVASFELLEDQE